MPVLERLFAAGDVNARAGTAPGQTPLMLAARKSNTTVVELLLRHGADVNTQDDIGNTALMCAIDCGNLEMVKLLIARPEINLDLKDQVRDFVCVSVYLKGRKIAAGKVASFSCLQLIYIACYRLDKEN